VAHQVFEQLELLRGQLDVAPGAGDATRQQVELEVGDLEPRRLARRRAASVQRFDARQQLGERRRVWSGSRRRRP
jgi:hypothetical protein